MTAKRVVAELTERQLDSCMTIAEAASAPNEYGCVLVNVRRSKAISCNAKGYVQLKVYGAEANKKVQLHQLVTWCHPDPAERAALRSAIRDGVLEISHLCKKKNCINPQHLRAETCAANKLRNGCSVVVCVNNRFFSCCRHFDPPCIPTDVDFAEAKRHNF